MVGRMSVWSGILQCDLFDSKPGWDAREKNAAVWDALRLCVRYLGAVLSSCFHSPFVTQGDGQ